MREFDISRFKFIIIIIYTVFIFRLKTTFLLEILLRTSTSEDVSSRKCCPFSAIRQSFFDILLVVFLIIDKKNQKNREK